MIDPPIKKDETVPGSEEEKKPVSGTVEAVVFVGLFPDEDWAPGEHGIEAGSAPEPFKVNFNWVAGPEGEVYAIILPFCL